MLQIEAEQSVATRRQVAFFLVGPDGVTPVTTEDGQQPEISVNQAAYSSTGIGVLNTLGNGHYYAELTQEILTAGARIRSRYKSANTAECEGESVQVVSYDTTAIMMSGSAGLYTLTVTVEDSDENAVSGATVQISDGTNTYALLSDANGEAAFSVNAGTWTVSVLIYGYASVSPVDVVVTANTSQTMTAVEVSEISYASIQDVYDIFGEENVKTWANSSELASTDDSYSTSIANRITKGLVYGYNEINDRLQGGPYEIPFTGAAVTPTIVRCNALFCGCWLYEWRRDDDDNDRYSEMEGKAERKLNQIRKGLIRFDNQTIVGTRAPGVV